MLEAFTYRKYKKHKMDKKLREANAREALDPQDEEFIRQSMDKGTTETRSPQGSSGSFLKRLGLVKKSSSSGGEAMTPTEDEVVAGTDAEGETGTATPGTQEADLSAVLNSLNVAVEKKRAFSFSEETRALLKEFTQILKDIQAGGPHAYEDLTSFLHKSNANLNAMFESIPDFMKALISSLPFPISRKLDKKSAKDVTADLLKDLMKPGVITGLFSRIMTVLRTRFPALIGSNALLALGVFVLLFGVWYCYKRGREERIKLGKEDPEPEVLVAGAKQREDDSTDHGDRPKQTTSTTPSPKFVATPEPVPTPVLMHDGVPVVCGAEEVVTTSPELVHEGLQVEGDATPQIQSDSIPDARKKSRTSWFKGKN